MTDHLAQLPPGNALDELVDQLLECGGVLSQIVGHMVRAEASGLSSPDAAPIAEVAHDVIRDAVSEKMARYGAADLTAAARVVKDATGRRGRMGRGRRSTAVHGGSGGEETVGEGA